MRLPRVFRSVIKCEVENESLGRWHKPKGKKVSPQCHTGGNQRTLGSERVWLDISKISVNYGDYAWTHHVHYRRCHFWCLEQKRRKSTECLTECWIFAIMSLLILRTQHVLSKEFILRKAGSTGWPPPQGVQPKAWVCGRVVLKPLSVSAWVMGVLGTVAVMTLSGEA